MIRSLLLGLILCGVAAPISPAGAQTEAAPVEVKSVRVSLDKNGHLRVSGDFENVESEAVADAIAGAGNLSIVFRGVLNEKLKRFSFVDQRPDDAFMLFCEVARVTGIKREGVWTLDASPKTASAKDKQIELRFRDVNVRQLLDMIGEQFKIKIRVDETSPETLKLQSINLSDMSAEQAIQTIADAANLELTREGETFVVKPRPIAP